MDVWSFADRYLRPYKVKNNEIIPELCPYCKGGQHHDKGTFALNISKLTYNCARGKCSKTGTFRQLCNDFGEEADRMEIWDSYKPQKTFKKPETRIEPLIDSARSYLRLRKISDKTMDAYKVGSDNKGNIVFPFYRNGDLVFVKFRPARKLEKGERKAWREADTEPILFGMDLCNPDYPLCIFEGEIDAMSGHEAGIPNCVSVPSGAEDLTWLDTCFEWLRQFKAVYLFGDNDDPGKEMIQKLTVRLSDYRLFIVSHPCKDCNELLYREGPEAVKRAYDNAKEVPVYGLIDLADVKPLDVKNIPSVKSNIPGLDSKIGGFLMGDLSVWTGKRGEGKSTLLGQLMLEAVDAGEKVCAYSGELRADRFQYWINLQAAGKNHISTYFDSDKGKDVYYIPKETLELIKEWYRGKFWIYDNTIADSTEETSILQVFEYAAKRYDCRVFLIDNLMSARYNTDSEANYYRAQSNFVGKLVEFANKYNVHVHLVCHPRKTNASLDNDDVSGTADITNRAANVFSLEKLKEEDQVKHGCDIALKILKNRWEGATGLIGLNYCQISRRLYVPSIGNNRVYGWEKSEPTRNWWERVEDESLPF
jgi:twinkle protein